MPDFTDSKTAELIKKAEALISNAQRLLEAGDDFFRQQGLDPQKVRSVLDAQMGPKERAEAEELARADLAAVEQEVAEEKARHSFSQGGASSSVKRPRAIV